MDVGEIIDDRFTRWARFLRENNARPMLVLGLTGSNDLVVTTCEGLPDEEVEEMLASTIILLRRKRGAPCPT